MLMAGFSRRTRRRTARVSGSEAAWGPDQNSPPGASSGRQRQGELRLRSTPRAFWRVWARHPSGLTASTSHRANPAGGTTRRSARVTASPAGSSPCTPPTIRRLRPACSGPTTTAGIGRWSTEWPMTRVRLPTATRGRAAGVGSRRWATAPQPTSTVAVSVRADLAAINPPTATSLIGGPCTGGSLPLLAEWNLNHPDRPTSPSVQGEFTSARHPERHDCHDRRDLDERPDRPHDRAENAQQGPRSHHLLLDHQGPVHDGRRDRGGLSERHAG